MYRRVGRSDCVTGVSSASLRHLSASRYPAFAAYSSLTFLAGGPAAAWNIQPESTERRLTCGLERTYAGVGCGSAIATNIAFATQIIPNSNVSPQFWVSFFTFHWGLGGDKFPLLLCSFQSLATPNLRPAAVNRAAFFPGPYEHGLTMTAFGQNLFMLLKHRSYQKFFIQCSGPARAFSGLVQVLVSNSRVLHRSGSAWWASDCTVIVILGHQPLHSSRQALLLEFLTPQQHQLKLETARQTLHGIFASFICIPMLLTS